MAKDGKKKAINQIFKPHLCGGTAAVFATMCVFPLDVIKTQIQVAKPVDGKAPGFAQCAKNIKSQSGYKGFYKGASAAIMRQVIYGTARLGLYDMFCDNIKSRNGTSTISFGAKTGAGMLSGAIAAVIGNPCDLSLVRMQADAALPVAERRGYSNIFTALARIVKEEGFATLWRGSLPIVLRGIAMNTGMMVSYDSCREYLGAKFGYNIWTTFLSSCFSGLVCSFTTMPFELLKVRIMNMKPDPVTKELPYKGVVDCTTKIFKNEGFLKFWKGYWVFWSRSAPHALIVLMTKPYLNQWWDVYFKN
ncbi:hypothetical protein WA158_008395 [Blastocystis sp. Blastoise]